MTIDKTYFQGGKDAKYLSMTKPISKMAEYVSAKLMQIGTNCYDAAKGLKKTATVPLDVVNELIDYTLQKVLGLKDTYKDLNKDGRKNLWNYIKTSLGKEGLSALQGVFNSKDSVNYGKSITNLALAASNMMHVDSLETKLGVA